MFGVTATSGSDAKQVLQALGRSLAIIEFSPEGKVLVANENFCKALGYEFLEIKGQHHSLFVEPDYARGGSYQEFWSKLRRGEHEAGEYKRLGKGGQEVWLQASYNPVRNGRGTVRKVVKQARVISDEKTKAAVIEGTLNAISRAQAVIEFLPSGQILTANENFCATVGYSLPEIQGQHHQIFVDPALARSADYTNFWRKLNSGEYTTGEFKRFGKGGKEVWLLASYNPIFDMNGKVVKIIKFATDVTGRFQAVSGIADALTKLAANEVTYRIREAFVPDFEPLRLNFNASLDNIQPALRQIAEGIDAINSGTNEISQASDDLSRRTEQQAASLEQTAAALDEITATVRKTAEGSRHASEVVGSAKTNAERSGVVVRKAIEAMGGIERSSNQIGQIVGVIDEIAFQTNLLALNAGVEAARAGETGRGFAVVASEVRALAQRSADAAKEIKALISASSQQVGQGVDLVGQTGAALEQIVIQVAEIATIVTDISASAQEQATALAEVNTAVNQMDQVTQQNAAMVEQSTAATQAVSREADELSRLIGQFDVGKIESPHAGSGHNVEGARRPVSKKPVAALRVVGRGGAAPKPRPEAAEWQEF